MCVLWWWWHVELGGAHKCLKPLTNLKHFCLDSGWWFAWISVNVIIVSGLRYQSANTFRECSYAEKLRLRNLLRLCDLRLSGLWHLRLWGLWRLRELAITESLPLLIPLPRKLLPLPTEPILRHASSVWKWCTPAKTSSLSGAPTLSHKFCMSEWRYQANKRDDECPFRYELNQEARRRHLTLWHWIKYWWFVKSCFVNHWSFIIKLCEGKVVTTTMMMSNFFELWWQRTFESGKVDDNDDEWYF